MSGCQTRDTANADPLKISGKLLQMELVLAYRGRAKPLLFLEVLKKSRGLTLERVVREVATSATYVTRDRQSQHLTNRVTRAVSHLPASVGLTFASRTIDDPCQHKRLDMIRQVRDLRGPWVLANSPKATTIGIRCKMLRCRYRCAVSQPAYASIAAAIHELRMRSTVV